jgi:hypothetical protein
MFKLSVGRVCATLVTLAALGTPAWASGPYVLGGLVGAVSGNSSYGWDGSENTAFRAALQTTANFGAGGTVSTPITTSNITSTATLTGINGLVIPWWFNLSATPTQVSQVQAFFTAGGDLFIGQDSSGKDPVGAAIGIPTLDGAGATWTPKGALATGPFGTSPSTNESGEIGYFSTTAVSSTGGTVGSTDGSGNVTVAYWPKHTFCSTCGSLIMIADIDEWTSEATYAPLNSNGIFALNAVAYMIQNSGGFSAPVGGGVPPTPAPATLWLTLIGLISAGTYLGYRRRETAR